MHPVRKLLLAGIAVLASVLIALPFRNEAGGRSRRPQAEGMANQPRWRGTETPAPVLAMEYGQSPAENLGRADGESQRLPQADRFAASPQIARPSPPPIPPSYQPLLESTSHEDAARTRDRSVSWKPTEAASSIPGPPPSMVVHRIRDGDTLPGIATRYLGDSGRADEIYQLNQARLPSPEILPLGVEIRIPANR